MNPPSFMDDDRSFASAGWRTSVAITHLRRFRAFGRSSDARLARLMSKIESWQHMPMQDARHRSPALTIFYPDQFRALGESRFVLRARLPVVGIVYLKNIPVLAQLSICLPDDRRWCIVHTMNPYYLFMNYIPQAYHSDPFMNSSIQYHLLLPWPAIFSCKAHKLRVPSTAFSCKAIDVPFDGFLTGTCIRVFRRLWHHPQYFRHTTSPVLFSPYNTVSTSDFANMSCDVRPPFAPKTWRLIITLPQITGAKKVYFSCSKFSIVLFSLCFYYEGLITKHAFHFRIATF